MTHSDDDGLVLPPRLAPVKVVIVPIPKPSSEIGEIATTLISELKAIGISAKYDHDDTKRPGFKFAEHEMQGIPVRVGIGARDIENGVVEVARRDTKEKTSVPRTGVAEYIKSLLDDIQANLLARALKYRQDMTSHAEDYEAFKTLLEEKGGFVYAHWDGTTETELRIKEETKATIRCLPLNAVLEEGKCVLTGKPSTMRVPFAKAY
jgi:prolyl-tRNA synthetase